MINQEDNTEKKILAAARTVFHKRGYTGARMEEIAKTAGVNKALLNYYFRSKEKLFKKVFQEAVHEFIRDIVKLLGGDLPLDMKIYRIVDLYTRMLLKNPDLPIFVLSEIREQPERLADMFLMKGDLPFIMLENQLKKAHEDGHIKRTSVYTFLMNVMSLTVFPFVSSPLMKNIFKMEESEFRDLILERKKTLPEMIINTFKT